MVGHEIGFDLLAFGEEAHMPPQPIDRLVTADIDQPGARIVRDAFARPLRERRGEGILHRIFGQFEIAEEPDQRGHHAAAFIAEHELDLIRHDSCLHGFCLRLPFRQACFGRLLRSGQLYTMIGRTSIEPIFADGTRAAIPVA